MMKYYGIRIVASFLILGSFGAGFLAGAEYGKWVGWITFLTFVILGALLLKVANKLRQTKL